MQYRFEDYRLDLERRELTRGSETVAVGPQVFDVLVHLVQNRERVISKDALLDAVWGGRIVSDSTLTSHINAARKAVGDTGREQRLLRTVARKGFRFVGDVTEVAEPGAAASTGPAASSPSPHGAPPATRPVLPDTPSIAVLPFVNLSGDPGQDYFADGVVEDIIAALSRIRWLFVIARNSSFTYKGRVEDVKQVGRELGVRYILEGSLRKADKRVRITGQLIDATSGAHIWADRFEGALDDIFALQDELTESVVGAIGPQLERAEIGRSKLKPTDSLNAYDYYLRGMAHLHRGGRHDIDQALPLLGTAIELDPEFASAYAMAAWCHFWRKINGWMTDRAREREEATRLARRAVDLGRDDAVALTRGGHALAHLTGDLDAGVALIDRALTLNPNLAAAWFLGGYLKIWLGEPDEAISRLARAMRFSPLDPEMYRMQAGMAAAHLFAGRFDAASCWAEKACRELPSFLMAAGLLAASHALAGRDDRAREAMRHVLRLAPSMRLPGLGEWLPIRRPEHLARLREGLHRAGLPA